MTLLHPGSVSVVLVTTGDQGRASPDDLGTRELVPQLNDCLSRLGVPCQWEWSNGVGMRKLLQNLDGPERTTTQSHPTSLQPAMGKPTLYTEVLEREIAQMGVEDLPSTLS